MLNIMSNVCCKELGGWFKSFTKIERALAILEAILLVVLIVLMVLLILHLVACSSPEDKSHFEPQTPVPTHKQHVDGMATSVSVTKTNVQIVTHRHKSTDPDVKCSWTPSAKTVAAVQYFEDGATKSLTTALFTNSSRQNGSTSPDSATDRSVESERDTAVTQMFDYFEDFIEADTSDGEDAEDEYKSYAVALVKLKPPKDVIFGCILTIISEYWTLTAASCIEAIEEIDSLDSFVIMEQYGTDSKGPIHTINDVQIHPLYEGKNKTYDLAALKSGDSLIKGAGTVVPLATSLDYALATIGERFTILGYGAFRSIDKSPSGRSLRQAYVVSLPSRQCAAAAAGEAVALRHLAPGRAVPVVACSTRALCASALFSRGLPCNYCSGTPLLRDSVLLGVMADSQQCGVACEPSLYVNIVAVTDWINATIEGE